jgi:hypothetical protein
LLLELPKKPPENIRLSDQLRGTKAELMRVAQEFGLEGLVAKKRESFYESGRRSGDWVKVKITLSQEFVIGRLHAAGGREGGKYFGSLLVGYHDSGGLGAAHAGGRQRAFRGIAHASGPPILWEARLLVSRTTDTRTVSPGPANDRQSTGPPATCQKPGSPDLSPPLCLLPFHPPSPYLLLITDSY